MRLRCINKNLATKYKQRRAESANRARGILGKYEIVYLNNIVYNIVSTWSTHRTQKVEKKQKKVILGMLPHIFSKLKFLLKGSSALGKN